MDLIKPGKCYDTYEVDIFNENFINHMNIEFGVEKYLWEKNFEEDWLGIWNFYISSHTNKRLISEHELWFLNASNHEHQEIIRISLVRGL